MQTNFKVSYTTYCETYVMNKEIIKALGNRKQFIRLLELTLIEIPKKAESPENKPESENKER